MYERILKQSHDIELLEENYQVIEFFDYLSGQVIIHPLESAGKTKKSESFTVLNFTAIAHLFDFRGIHQSLRWNLFRKLWHLNNFYYNEKDHSAYSKSSARASLGGVLKALNI